MLKPSLLALAVSQAFVATSTMAEEAVQDEIFVTGSRTTETLDSALASVKLIDSDMIDQLKPRDLLQVLSQLGGLTISQSGGIGSASSVFVRGTNADHTLILVDGVRINSATLGTASLQHINPSQIDRIEIVKGTRSSVYGSDAIGGVIQIFTKKAKPASGANLQLGFGSNNSQKATFSGQYASEEVSFNGSISNQKTDGFSRLVDDGSIVNLDGDDDGYKNQTLSFSGAYNGFEAVQFNGQFFQSSGETEYDAGPWGAENSLPFTNFKVSSLSIGADGQLSDSLGFSATASQGKDESESLDKNIVGGTQFNTERNQYSGLLSYSLDEFEGVVGFDLIEESIESSTNYAETSRSNQGAFAEIAYKASELLNLNVGVRQDDNEAFGKETTFHTALGSSFSDSFSLVASLGTGFKAPTFNDLYYPTGMFSGGNQDLLPENSTNADLELRFQGELAELKLAMFSNKVENLIEWAPDENFFYQPQNVSEVEFIGAEFSATTELAGIVLDGQFNVVEAKNSETDNLLIRRPTQSATLLITKFSDGFSYNLAIKAEGDRYQDANNTVSSAGYTLVDATVSYQVLDKLNVNAQIKNLFDREYEVVNGYNTEDRTFMIGATFEL